MTRDTMTVSVRSTDTLPEQVHAAYMLGTFLDSPVRIDTDNLAYAREVYPSHISHAAEVTVNGQPVHGPFDALLSTEQAAARKRVTPQTIRNWIRSGRLTSEVGWTGAVRVSASALTAMPSGPPVPLDLLYWLNENFDSPWTVRDVLSHPDHWIYLEPQGETPQGRATSAGKYLGQFVDVPSGGLVLRRHAKNHRASCWSVEVVR